MSSYIEKRVKQREKVGNLRILQVARLPIDFASNDYLSLASSDKLTLAVNIEKEAILKPLNGFGATGSRLLTGNSAYAELLERHIASFHGLPAGALFSCGYMANVGLLSTVACSESVIFYDQAIHASSHDGIVLSRAKSIPFRHNDIDHLERRLKSIPRGAESFICVESIYSTDGSIAPLADIAALAKKYHSNLIVDEAHAVGATGPSGRGMAAKCGIMDQIFALVVTFGKALGVHGAIVLGSELLKKALINFATPYVYTTAPPFHMLAAIKCAYDLFPEMEDERLHLQKLSELFRLHFSSSSCSHIQYVKVAGNEAVRHMASSLQELGFDVRPLMSPTVRRGHELIRICLHAHNNEEDLLRLIESIKMGMK